MTVTTPRAALLDVDGTLVDSNDLHAEAWVETLNQRGFDTHFAQVRPLIGMGGDKLLPLLTQLSPEDPRGEQIKEARTQLFVTRYLPRVQPLPGARALLERLLAAGYKLVVATSANEQELSGLLERGGVADLLKTRTSSDDAERSKPDEDIVVAALHKAGVSPAAAVMLGDTPYDLEAARGAQVPFVGFESGGYQARALAGALAVYRDPADLVRQFDGSPLALR